MGWWYVVAAAWLLMGKPGPANAQAAESTADELMSEDQLFEHEAAQFDQEALTPDGERIVRQRFAYQFNVDEARLQSLKDRSLGYGEIYHTLSIAQRMPGGITEENVDRILTLRQGQSLEWADISKRLTPAPKTAGMTEPAETTSSQPQAAPGAVQEPTVSAAASEVEAPKREGFFGWLFGHRAREAATPAYTR